MKWYQMDSVQGSFKFRYKIVKIGKKSQQIPNLAVVNEKICTTRTKDFFFSLFAPLSGLIWWKLSKRQQKEENKTRMNKDMAA